MSRIETDTRTRILQTTWALLEDKPGHSIKMGEIAKASGVSRQALYLHFTSRSELLIATTRYVDEVKGLDARLAQIESANTGSEMLSRYVNIWGNYIPEIYGVSKALMMTKDNDEAAAAAWKEITGCLLKICSDVTKTLKAEGSLSPFWSQKRAAEFFWTMISIYNWEQLTQECGWSNKQYISHTENVLLSTLIVDR